MQDKAQKDNELFNNIISTSVYNDSKNIFVYVSTEIEVDTITLIKYCLLNKKRAFVPLCNADDSTMEFYEINSLNDLHKGYYGIMEPESDCMKKAVPDNESLMIVPGLSFSSSGYRLGYGKGFYDKYLSQHKCTTIGLCYDEFLNENLPMDQHDIPVDFIVTDNNIIKTEENYYGR